VTWNEVVTLICWGIVVVVWIAGAVYGARKAPGSRQGSEQGALWRLGAVVVAVVAYRVSRHYLHRYGYHTTWLELIGLVVLLASTGFTLWARFSLGRMWSATPNMLRAGHQLRTDGPYSVTRHPIYSGLLGMLLGSILLNGLGASLVLLIVAGAVVITRIPVEERLMETTFPDEYPRYRERVPRLVPGAKLLRKAV
jgi:protein-S-isoprenylcysteine O-methyltransferase Ste14